MKKLNLLFVMLFMAWTMQACNNPNRNSDAVESAEDINEDKSNVNDDLSDFMVKAASGGMMEVQLGETAQQNAMNQSVKNFGSMMVKDHSAANGELKTLASAKNITLPAAVGEDHQEHVNKLMNLKGSEFDQHYMEMMVDDHKEDIDLFEKAANSNDPDLQAFANKTLPVLKMHLDSAKAINDRLKDGKNNL